MALFKGSSVFVGFSIRFCLLLALIMSSHAATARNFEVLHGFSDGNDGGSPLGSLIIDNAGNLYGTAAGGGGVRDAGVVFKLAPNGTETVLHSFDLTDGSNPEAALITDQVGNFYSTTYQGSGCCGEVFKLAPDGTLTVLYSFCSQANCSDGASSYSGVVSDSSGNLYGTTYSGGGSCSCGVVYKLSTNGSETVLHAFAGSPSDGAGPFASLKLDKKGNLYGTTDVGGANGDGTVFKMRADGTETLLHSFDLNDGFYPTAGLISDSTGNLYGTTYFGGAYSEGVVFKLAADGAETVLYSFTGTSDGAHPAASLILDKGNLYGTTSSGGDLNCGNGIGCGTVFQLATNGALTVLHTFKGVKDGADPVASVTLRGNRLYGMTRSAGADGYGTVFALKK